MRASSFLILAVVVVGCTVFIAAQSNLFVKAAKTVASRAGLIPPGGQPSQLLPFTATDGTRAAALTLYVFPAPPTQSRTPAVLFFHGGGWQLGNPSQFYPQCIDLARAGFTCISAGYRTAENAGTDPLTAVADARAAYAEVRRQADALGIDRERIAVGGGSAGGHLALMTCLGDADLPAPAALVLFNPVMDLSPGTFDHHLVADDWQALSPLHLVDHPMPPTLLMLGTEDREIPVSAAEALKARYEAQGSELELRLYEGHGHGFFNRAAYRPTLSAARAFLKERL